jgi:hypothetical protein
MTSALSLIETLDRMRAALRDDPRRLEQLARLQRWQVQRLRHTYADLMVHPAYRDALDFFVQDLYGPHDVAQRDRDLRKVLQQWERVLTKRAIEALSYALELQALSQSLDLALVDALKGAEPTELSYPRAYRAANRRHDRQRQIWLILAAGHALDGLVRVRTIGTALRMARLPARLAGVTVLHDFLERGYLAFSKMHGAEELLRAIEQRETELMQRLFEGSADPFQFGNPPSAKSS